MTPRPASPVLCAAVGWMFFCAWPSGATDGACQVGTRSLVQVSGTSTVVALKESDTMAVAIDARGCRIASAVFTRDASLTPIGHDIGIYELRAAERQRLTVELAAANIGAARDCRWDFGGGYEVSLRVFWTGRGSRRNSFAVTSASTDLPACSPAIKTLLGDALLTQ